MPNIRKDNKENNACWQFWENNDICIIATWYSILIYLI